MIRPPTPHKHYFVCHMTENRCAFCDEIETYDNTVFKDKNPIYTKLKASFDAHYDKLVLPSDPLIRYDEDDFINEMIEAMISPIDPHQTDAREAFIVRGSQLRGVQYGPQTGSIRSDSGRVEDSPEGSGRVDPESTDN